MDIHKAFNNIFVRNIIHIAFGEDISHECIEIWIKTDLEGVQPMVLTKMTFGEAVFQVGEQMFTIYLKMKIGNPLWRAIYAQFGLSVSFTSTERTIDENCRRMRVFVNDYI